MVKSNLPGMKIVLVAVVNHYLSLVLCLLYFMVFKFVYFDLILCLLVIKIEFLS